MPIQVLMPQLGESVVEGTISRWLKAKGESVEEFEPLVEINTDKVDTEVPSPASGILLEILVEAGVTTRAGMVLALIGTNADAAPEQRSAFPPPAVGSSVARPTPGPAAATSGGRGRELGFISPVVARLSREHQVDLTQVTGTGEGGRITKKDVLAFMERRSTPPVPSEPRAPAAAPALAPQPATPAPPPATVPPPGAGTLMPFTTVRKAIAEHMVLSRRTSPHATTVMEADLSPVVAHRTANKAAFAKDGVNLTFTAYFVAAIVAALKAHPLVNASWTEEGIWLHRDINIGMATSLGEGGLIVPVIKNADSLSLLGLARAINDLANRARSRQLKPDEVKGGTFTLTNHGMNGSLFAAPIINQPQCGILGAGAIQKRVVVIESEAGDALAIRPMIYISFTFDHRILDGAIADYFLGKVVQYLENYQG